MDINNTDNNVLFKFILAILIFFLLRIVNLNSQLKILKINLIIKIIINIFVIDIMIYSNHTLKTGPNFILKEDKY